MSADQSKASWKEVRRTGSIDRERFGYQEDTEVGAVSAGSDFVFRMNNISMFRLLAHHCGAWVWARGGFDAKAERFVTSFRILSLTTKICIIILSSKPKGLQKA